MPNQANNAYPDPRGGGRAPGVTPRRTASRGVAALAVLALIGGGVYVGVSRCSGGTAAPTATPPPTTSATAAGPSPLTGAGTAGRVLAVKIDNVGVAQRQQTGLNGADLVYVIEVEGGLSRYLVVYDSAHAPARVGPVRSARQSDIPLLAAFGRVGLAYTGAISGLLPDLASADLQNITPGNAARLFSNGGSSPTYISPAQVFAAYPNLAEAKDVGLRFGATPAGGQAAASVTASMPSASFTFTAAATRWLVSVDGHSATTTDQGRTSTDNVIVQHVRVVPGKYTDFNAGHPDNEVFSQTTGEGPAEFYRDGEVWHGHWSKAGDTAPTDYTVNGAPMPLRPGRTWIVLVGGG
ncbi:DUF3048 domain-containing protein [Actinocrinis puniceicyclus]|uniref:DUF3048 domain-containing protein n=1 Tax=Actinocrinis puniceicyclus TaxID=977794 RepID=A0A8J7WTI4_9ACTN|nr:DUF3048 domain-containing protein [Actinocrinis puniceicyclus]MBS2965732.1 DUF3048 domain-containing protein [Actinocrinis puniceicyclus]